MNRILLCIPVVLVPSVLMAAPDLVVPGALLTDQTPVTVTRSALPASPWQDDQPMRHVEGPTVRTAWEILNTRATPLQLALPLREALLGEGYDIRFECADVECGGFDFRFALDTLPPPAMFVDLGSYHYVLASNGDNEVAVLSSQVGTSGFVHVTVVGPLAEGQVRSDTDEPPLTRPTLLTPDAAPADPTEDRAAPLPDATQGSVGDRLAATGRVPLDDLAFASGSTELADGASADLTALANWLRANPASRIALVGHTDAVGSLEGNTRLSRARAEAVARRLISDFEISPDRVEAEGAGYLAPRAPNSTADGRARNRRVEAVLLDTE